MDTIIETAVTQGQAWRISFGTEPPTNNLRTFVITEPRRLYAVAEQIDVGDALTGTASEMQRDDQVKSMLIVWLPADIIVSRNFEQQLDGWLSEGFESKRPALRSGLRTSRVVYTDRRAIIYTSADQVTDVMDAVLRFAIASRETAQLEREMSETWPRLESEIPSFHTIAPENLKLKEQLDSVEEHFSDMQAMLIRVQTALEQLDPGLSAASKRLYAELAEQALLFDRLESLEDPIEFAQDRCELAQDRCELAQDRYDLVNSRTIDAKNVSREHFLEILIVALLAAELVLNLTTRLL